MTLITCVLQTGNEIRKLILFALRYKLLVRVWFRQGSLFDIVNLPYDPQRWYFCHFAIWEFRCRSLSELNRILGVCFSDLFL